MARYKYVIVGGGMAADAAIAGIRRVDPAGSIGSMTTPACGSSRSGAGEPVRDETRAAR